MADNPPYVAWYQRWRDAASLEEKRQLLHRHPRHTKLLPSIEALRDLPEKMIMPNGLRLIDCDAVELAAMAEYFLAVRAAVRARVRKIERCDALTGVTI